MKSSSPALALTTADRPHCPPSIRTPQVGERERACVACTYTQASERASVCRPTHARTYVKAKVGGRGRAKAGEAARGRQHEGDVHTLVR